MPSPFVINGRRTYAEGARSRTDWSKMNGAAQATKGVVALLGEWSVGGKSADGHECSTAQTLRGYLPEPDATYLSKALFQPSKQTDRVPKGASKVIHVRVNPADRASLELENADGPVAVAYDQEYGLVGNDTTIKIENGTNVGRKVTVVRDGETEVVDDAGSLDALLLKYTSYEAPLFTLVSMLCSVVPATGIEIVWTVEHADNSTWDWEAAGGGLPINGALTITLIAKESAPRAFVVTGRDAATGAVVEETISFTVDDLTKTSTHDFSTITQIVIPDLTNVANLNKATFSATGFDLPKAQYDTIAKVASKVNAQSSKGFTGSLKTATTGFLVADLDTFTDEDIVNGGDGLTVTADLYDFLADCNDGFSFATFEAYGTIVTRGLPDALVETGLAGGQDNYSDDGTKAANWQAALNVLADYPVTSVLPMSTDPAVWALCLDHCALYWGEGGFERDLWVGAEAKMPLDGDGTDDNLYALSRGLNSELATLCCQEVSLYDNTLTKQWVSPMYAAAYGCGMEAGRVNQDSIMWAQPDVVDVRDNPDDADSPWTVRQQAEELLGHGLFVMEKRLRDKVIRWKRDVTTYQQDDNPVKSSRFGTTQHGLSVRDVRQYLEHLIGTGNWAGTAEDIRSETNARLDKQKGTLIKDFDQRSTVAIDNGDGFEVGWDEEPAEAIGWIEAVAHPQRRPRANV
jgi:hypothetical protein